MYECHFLPIWCATELFSAKISRNLAPDGCFPLEDGCAPRVLLEPRLRLADGQQQVLVCGTPFELTLAFLLPHPGQRGNAVGIDRPGEVVLLEVREAEDEGEELANVIRTLHVGTAAEDLGTGVGDDPAKLHDTGVSGTGSIDGQSR